MVIAKLISGLGNQLFQYAIGRQIAIANGVDLKLDTSFFAGQHLRSYKLHHYNINAEIAPADDVAALLKRYTGKSLPDKVYRRVERLLPKRYTHYFKEKEWWGYEPELLKASGSVYLEGYWQHHKYFDHLSPGILKELTLKEAHGPESKALLAEISQAPSSVAIHVRRGDYVSDTNTYNFMGVLPVAYYNQAISYIGRRVPSPVYYVFSDDPEWAKCHLKADAPLHFVTIADGSKDYLELDLMSKCRHNIIANSSFSWWGAFLNNHPGKIVVAHNKWVIPDDVNARIKLQFPSWVKL